jgi:bifunctional non-homologous end joining protein LigD
VEGVAITNPERIVDPDTGFTKLGLAEFYAGIQDWILPYMANRLLSLVRCPEGQAGECFYQKHLAVQQAPQVPRLDFAERRGTTSYVYVRSIGHLVALVQAGVMEFHLFGSQVGEVERPDLMVLDLDPGPGVDWPAVVKAARALRDRLDAMGLRAFVRTTGGKGLHVVVPLKPAAEWAAVKAFAHAVARQHAADDPRRFTTTLTKARRKGKIFIDYLRNGRGATAIASYSTRARPGLPVAVPVRWEELGPRLSPDRYTVANLPRRLGTLRTDPWDGFFADRVALTRPLQRAAGLR